MTQMGTWCDLLRHTEDKHMKGSNLSPSSLAYLTTATESIANAIEGRPGLDTIRLR